MTVVRTYDQDYIRSVVCHPQVFPYAVDEGFTPETWQPPMGGIWLRPLEYEGVVAYVYHVSGLIWAYDAALVPQARAPAISYADRRAMFPELKAWVAAHTNCKHLIALIAEPNQRSERAALADGLQFEGRLPKSKKWKNQLVDTLIYGMEL